jgi:hypothetical protein
MKLYTVTLLILITLFLSVSYTFSQEQDAQDAKEKTVETTEDTKKEIEMEDTVDFFETKKEAVEQGKTIDTTKKLEVEQNKPAERNGKGKARPGKTAHTYTLEEETILISFYATYGITYPGGDVAGESASRKIDRGYAIGLQAAYLLRDNGALTIGLGYTQKSLKVSRSFVGQDLEQVYNCEFLELSLGYKGFIKQFFWEAGLFGGFVLGDWQQESTVNGSSSSSTIDKSDTQHEAGIYVGTGYIFPVSKKVTCDIGLRISTAFLSAYDNNDSLRTNMVALMCAATYRVQ